MIAIAALLFTKTFSQEDMIPALWLDPQGEIFVEGQPEEPVFDPGVAKIRTPLGIGYDFNGSRSGILFGDKPALKLGGNLTVSAWLYPRSYAPNGAQAEVLFRGDDRDGYDPYSFVLTKDGTINFVIQDDKNESAGVKAPIPLNQWTHVTASLNVATGELALWTDGIKVSTFFTTEKPLVDLIAKYVPGVGVGNVQNDKGPHNQPYNGIIADLRLYARVLTPMQVGYHLRPVSTGAQP